MTRPAEIHGAWCECRGCADSFTLSCTRSTRASRLFAWIAITLALAAIALATAANAGGAA